MSALDIALLVAAIATALFTGWAVWQRWRYTPRPMWVAPVISSVDHAKDSATLIWRIENRGDAAAHDVHVHVKWEHDWLELLGASSAMVHPGEAALAARDVPSTGSGEYSVETGRYERTPELTWTATRVRVTWRQHPNLRRVKTNEWDLPAPKNAGWVIRPKPAKRFIRRPRPSRAG